MDIESSLLKATSNLSDAGIPTPRLDAEVILSHLIKRPHSWIVAHARDELVSSVREEFMRMIDLRLKRLPVAYIVGHKEFYGRDFIVTPDVLIPRPESELIIELAKKYLPTQKTNGLDMGTGSGALGISLALELPQLTMYLSDIDQTALNIAQQNAEQLSAPIAKFIKSDLFESIKGITFGLIVANLPYVDQHWERSPETDHEPPLALFANNHGLEIIKKCIQTVQGSLNHEGYLMLESDPSQQTEIRDIALMSGLTHIATVDYISLFYKP